MKDYYKKILLTLFTFLSITIYAQNENIEERTELNEVAEKMFVDMNNRDFDAILEMTHPKVFEMVPKEQMKTVIKSMFEGNEDFSMEVPKMEPKYKLSKLYTEDKNNLSYAFVTYDMNMKMTFHKQKFDDEEGKQMMTSLMKAKDINIKFISDNVIDMMMNNRLTIILKDDSTKNKWVMVNYDPDSPMFYQILPASLLEAAKEYKQKLMIESKKKEEEESTQKN